MLNSIKIKIRSMLLSFKRKPKAVFVNPYAPAIPVASTKINPYVTEYGAVKKKSADEIIRECLVKPRNEEPVVAVPVNKGPTFAHDMKGVFIGDIMWVASRFGVDTKKKERVMTAEEILKACENTKW